MDCLIPGFLVHHQLLELVQTHVHQVGVANNCYILASNLSLFSNVQSVQLLSHVQLFATPLIGARQVSLSITSSRSLLKLMSIELVRLSNHLIPCCCPLFFLPSIFPSIWVFSNKLVLRLRWPMYWSLSFSISPSMNLQD